MLCSGRSSGSERIEWCPGSAIS